MPVAVILQIAMSLTPLAQGSMSRIDLPREVIVRSTEAWRALWQEHAPGTALPDVDFSTRTVVGVLLGMRPTAGFRVDITGVSFEDDTVVVTWVERRPGPDAMVAQVITAPFQFSLIEATVGGVRLRQITDTPP